MLLLGASVGFVAGLLGIGGGMLMVPFLIALLQAKGVPAEHVVQVAIATSLATILFTSLSSVRAHHRLGAVRWDAVAALAPGIVFGSIAGAQLAAWLSGRILSAGFGAFVALMATRMLSGGGAASGTSSVPELPRAPVTFGVGGAIGVISALVGAGGAFLTVPFLTSCRLKIPIAVGTSAACGFPIALAGTLGYVWAGLHLDLAPGIVGYLYLPALLIIVVASVVTAPYGARLAHRLPMRTLRRLFAVLLYAIAAHMLWKAATLPIG
ncbi:MAG TPA: sulfite exporter TauE/SafE family protein [Burkholderiaceae bacterium]|nr:sulfite exporter TauE/SafE family protein [Burkholderiaceae bacterium]